MSETISTILRFRNYIRKQLPPHMSLLQQAFDNRENAIAGAVATTATAAAAGAKLRT